MAQGRSCIALVLVVLLTAACSADPAGSRGTASGDTETTSTQSSGTELVMPDLVGLPADKASRRLGELEGRARLGLASSWRPQVVLDCEVRPHTIVRQAPTAGTPLTRRTEVHVWTAELDLSKFRGPCEPPDGDRGPLTGPMPSLLVSSIGLPLPLPPMRRSRAVTCGPESKQARPG